MTLVVNLFAGPGTGKSTNTALAFGKLKTLGIQSEIVHEFAKDLVWENRDAALAFQPYVAGKQMYHIHRLLDQVDVIITDAPILLCSHIYGKGKGYCEPSFKQFMLEVFYKWNTLNILLKRDATIHPYVEGGRNQTEDEAKAIDRKIERMLKYNDIKYHPVKVTKGEQTADEIVELIQNALHR